MFWSPLTTFLKRAWEKLWGLASFWTSGPTSTRSRSISDEGFEMFRRPLRPVRVPRMAQSLPDYRWDPRSLERTYGDWKDEPVLVKMYR